VSNTPKPRARAAVEAPAREDRAARVSIPPEFAKAVYPLLAPGTTMMVTDAAVLESTTGTMLAVVTNEPPPAKP
jgi:hypothetical protein